jgi:WD40 repeat protein
MKRLIFHLLILISCSIILSNKAIAQKSKPKIVVTVGHADIVNYIAISPDNKIAASVAVDNSLKLWDIFSGKELRNIEKNKKSLNWLEFTNDGKFLVTSNTEGLIVLWDIKTGESVFEFQASTYAIIGGENIDVKKNKGVYCTGSFGIKTINLETKEEKEIKGYKSMSVCFHPKNDNEILFVTMDNRLIRYDVVTNQVIKEIAGIPPPAPRLRVSNDGRYLLGVSIMSFSLWDLQTGKLIGTINDPDIAYRSTRFHPKTNQIVVGTSKPSPKTSQTGIRIINPKNLRIVKEISEMEIINTMGIMTFSDDGKYLAMAGLNRSIEVFGWDSMKKIKSLVSHATKIESVETSFSYPYILVLGYDLVLRVWNLRKQRTEYVIPFIQKFCISNNGKYFATYGFASTFKGNGITVWDLKKTEKIAEIPLQIGMCTDIEFTSDNLSLMVADINQSVTVWDIASKKNTLTITGLPAGIPSISVSLDNKYVAASSMGQNGIMIYDRTNGNLVKKLSHDYVYTLKFSRNSKYLASSGVQDIKIYDTENWIEIKNWRKHQGIIPSLCFDHKSKVLASCSGSNPYATQYPVKIWDVGSANLICDLIGHTNHVCSASFYRKKGIVVSGSFDAMVKIWDVKKCKELVSLVAIDKEDYIIITSDNYYTGSKGSMNGVGFRYDNRLYPFEQFDLKLNRPDIVAGRIGVADQPLIDAYKKAYKKRLKKMNFSEDMFSDDWHIPEIEIIESNELKYQSHKKSVNLKIMANDNKYLLDRINVWINDIPIYGIAGINLRNENKSEVEKELKLELSNGKNKIQVSALNQKGVESMKKTLFLNYAGKTTKPDLYIVAIGVSEYENSDFNLEYAAKDAEDIVAAFGKMKDRFANIHTIKILNKDATKDNILNCREKLMQSKVDDQVVLFTAGHGLLDHQLDYYFGTTNINFINPSENGLAYNDLEGLIDGIPARKKLVLIDACHSGEVDKDEVKFQTEEVEQIGEVRFRSFKPIIVKKETQLGLKNSYELMKELFADLRRGSGAMVISSAGGGEFAFESKEWNNGVFTYSVLEGFTSQNADINKDGKILVSELREYVANRVSELTNGKQNPTARRENVEFDFRVW